MRPFGQENRTRLIHRYLESAGDFGPGDAWLHVYRLLLWTDPTNGLAHCYESDKCQPGRTWYARSLRFHQWLAEQTGSTALDLDHQIDWLFRAVTEELAETMVAQARVRQRRAEGQLAEFQGIEFPRPGEDPELAALISGVLEPWLREAAPE